MSTTYIENAQHDNRRRKWRGGIKTHTYTQRKREREREREGERERERESERERERERVCVCERVSERDILDLELFDECIFII